MNDGRRTDATLTKSTHKSTDPSIKQVVATESFANRNSSILNSGGRCLLELPR